MTFLALDIGNTRLKWAHYASPRPGAALLAQGAEFLENIDKLADGAWSGLPSPRHVLGCVVAGDAVKRRVQEQMDLWDVVPQWVVSSEAEAGLRNGYDHPTRLGADRWVAMIGAYHHMLSQGPARPMVLVMVGTAVTVEAIDAQGKFLGGLILPGHGIMLRALESGTAGLHVPTGEVRDFPTNTSDASAIRVFDQGAGCTTGVSVSGGSAAGCNFTLTVSLDAASDTIYSCWLTFTYKDSVVCSKRC